MKKILKDDNKDFVKLDKLTGKEFAAYSTKVVHNKGVLAIVTAEPTPVITGYCVLSRLENGNFGFVNLSRVGTAPSFVGTSYEDSMAKCSKKREVCVFDSYEEMLTAILAKSF